MTKTNATLPVDADQKNNVTVTAEPMMPVRKTGLRPIRSDSAPNIGMVKMAMKLETSDSHSMAVGLMPMP